MRWSHLPVMIKIMTINTGVLIVAIFSTSAIVATLKVFQPSIAVRIIAVVICALILSVGLAWSVCVLIQLIRLIRLDVTQRNV